MTTQFKKGIWYLAHPYTCKDKYGEHIPGGEEANYNLSNIRAAKLIEQGYLIYSPISHSHPIHTAWPAFVSNNVIHNMWYEFDKQYIEQIPFVGIILAPGWEDSEGCKKEKALFERLGREIKFYEKDFHWLS